MKNLLFTLALLVTISALSAQDLHIFYNLETQTPRYVIDSQEVKRPYVRRGANVILHIENYNNYLYDVVIEQENREIRLPANVAPSSLSNIFPILGKNSTDFLPPPVSSGSRGLSGLIDSNGTGGSRGSNLPTSFSADSDLTPREEKQINEALKKFDAGVTKMETIAKNMTIKRQAVQALVESHQVNAFLMQEIDNIKYDPALKPAQIKRMTRAYMCKALNIKNDTAIVFDLDSLFRKGNTRAQLVQMLEEVKTEHDVYRNEQAKLNAIKEELSTDFGKKFRVSTLVVEPVVASYDVVANRETEISNLENNLLQWITTIPDVDFGKLAAVWRQYEALLGNSFTKNHSSLAQSDDMVFNIRFTPNQTGASRQVPALQLSPIQVPVAGGFKVNASVGVAFGQLFDQPLSYFVRDSIIRTEAQDRFLPLIASFFHFYGQSKGTVSFGGNFGIGLPITGDSGQGASFFLGPSLIIGRGERLVLNGGFLGTRVTRLAQGFAEGDRFRSQVNNVPTKNVYELGYFLGLSFNVLGGSR
jgi:hypothetical protein